MQINFLPAPKKNQKKKRHLDESPDVEMLLLDALARALPIDFFRPMTTHCHTERGNMLMFLISCVFFYPGILAWNYIDWGVTYGIGALFLGVDHNHWHPPKPQGACICHVESPST